MATPRAVPAVVVASKPLNGWTARYGNASAPPLLATVPPSAKKNCAVPSRRDRSVKVYGGVTSPWESPPLGGVGRIPSGATVGRVWRVGKATLHIGGP